MNNIEALTRILKDSRNVVFFGGAGMSTESASVLSVSLIRRAAIQRM